MATELPERELSDAERAYNDMESRICNDQRKFDATVLDALLDDGELTAFLRAVLHAHIFDARGAKVMPSLDESNGEKLRKMLALSCDSICTRAAEKVG